MSALIVATTPCVMLYSCHCSPIVAWLCPSCVTHMPVHTPGDLAIIKLPSSAVLARQPCASCSPPVATCGPQYEHGVGNVGASSQNGSSNVASILVMPPIGKIASCGVLDPSAFTTATRLLHSVACGPLLAATA